MSTKPSKCVFCGSASYGKNCPWSHFVTKIHLHTDDSTKCSFCGSSTKIGPGCPFSPTGKHMVGANFFTGLAAESFIQAYMMNKLSEPISVSRAFKLGLIDARGNVVKKPDTLEEHMAFTAIDSYLIKLKTLLGNRVDLLNNEVYLEACAKNAQVPIELYEKEVRLKNMMKVIVKHFNEVINEAAEHSLPLPLIEKIILEAFKE